VFYPDEDNKHSKHNKKFNVLILNSVNGSTNHIMHGPDYKDYQKVMCCPTVLVKNTNGSQCCMPRKRKMLAKNSNEG
jgi:hypothetical protein